MSCFLDANVLIYAAVPGEHQAPCLEILEAVADHGARARSSPAVLEEVWHVERSGRAGSLDGLARRAYTVLTPLLEVDDRAFALALGVDAPALGTNDRLRSGTCAAHGIDVIVSADRGFDAVTGLRRLDLLDTAAVRALLKSG